MAKTTKHDKNQLLLPGIDGSPDNVDLDKPPRIWVARCRESINLPEYEAGVDEEAIRIIPDEGNMLIYGQPYTEDLDDD